MSELLRKATKVISIHEDMRNSIIHTTESTSIWKNRRFLRNQNFNSKYDSK